MILVICMRSWGELGNYAAAKQLQRHLELAYNSTTIELLCADDYVDTFRGVGEKIKLNMSTSSSPDEVNERYVQMMAALDISLKVGEHNEPIAPLVEKVKDMKPRVVICTKGVIARVLAPQISRHAAIFNYVTNHGHFTMPVHVGPNTEMNYLVRTEEAREYFEQELKIDRSRVGFVGYISSVFGDIPTVPAGEPQPLNKVLIVSNRGCYRYLQVLHSILVETQLSVDYIIVGDSPREKVRVSRLYSSFPGRGRLHSQLEQREYFGVLASLNQCGGVLIAKASINTLIEAVLCAIPVVGLRSGLPMEDWGGDFLKYKRLGKVCDTADEVKEFLRLLVESPDCYQDMVASTHVFRSRFRTALPSHTRSVIDDMVLAGPQTLQRFDQAN